MTTKPQPLFRFRTVLLAMLALAVASPSFAADRKRIGSATGAFGTATIDGNAINVGTPVYEGSVVTTGAADAAGLLLDSKVVVKLDANTTVTVTEIGGTHVDLKKGTVQVYLAKRDGMAGAVALSDPDATIEALGTVFIASNTGNGGYYATVESTRPQGVRIKGLADAGFSDLSPGKQVTARGRKLAGIGPLDAKQLTDLIPNIKKLEGVQRKMDGAFGRKQAAALEAVKFAAPGGVRIAGGERIIVADQSAALSSAVTYASVVGLTHRGIFSSSGSTGGGGGGGGSTGGLSDIGVTLDAGNVLRFNLYDSGIEDGDNVSLRVTSGGKTYLSRTSVTLANAGQIFSPTVPANSVVTISFTALNEGTSPPNTGGLQILSNVTSGSASQIYNVTTGQTAKLRVKTK